MSKLKAIWVSIFILAACVIIVCLTWSTGEKSPVDYSHAVTIENEEGKLPILYFSIGGRNHWLNPDYISSFEELQDLKDAYRFGYEFEGWYLDPNFEVSVKDVVRIPRGLRYLVVYAKWNDEIDNRYNVETYQYLADHKLKSETLRLKDISYSFMEDLKIPGMPSTKNDDMLNSFIFSQDQYPQGICLTEDYVLISAYSETEECMGEILVFNKSTNKLLLTLGMDADSHLGGIAYDGENVWVCNSFKKTIERISYDFIKLMAEENTGNVIDCREVVDSFAVSNTPSCITAYGGRLWIASHTKLISSRVVSYYFNKKEKKLMKLSSYRIPSQVQGIAFDENGRVYLSTSFGRNNSSYLKIYESTVAMSDRTDKPLLEIEMPPCSEEIDISNSKIYVLFESAGEKYYLGSDGKGSSLCPLDKVLNININFIPFDQNQKKNSKK